MTEKKHFNLETAVQDDKVMQDFELESLPMGVDHSQKVKATHIGSDCSSKDCVNLSSSTAISRFNTESPWICPVSGETREEERLNYLTHLLGLFLSLIGGGILFWACLSGDVWRIISSCAYIITLIGLYAASSFYHWCDLHLRKKTLRIVDHSCIYLFIAGSYTPFTLGPLRDSHGWELFFVVWGIAIFGVVFKIIAVDRFKALSLCSYLLMGWLVTFSFPTLFNELSSSALMWFIAGGLSYTFGTIFFAWESLRFSHAIWHLFVLSGSFCHYFAILDITQKNF